MLTTWISKHWFAFLLVLAAGALAVQNVSLAQAYAGAKKRIEWETQTLVQPGDRIDRLVGTTPGGSAVALEFDGNSGRTLVIGMSVTCPICQQNMPEWRRLASEAVDRGVRVVWLSRDAAGPMDEFARGQSMPGNLVAQPDYLTYMQSRLMVVPQTFVVDSEGVVTLSSAGPLTAEFATELSTVIDQIPGGP